MLKLRKIIPKSIKSLLCRIFIRYKYHKVITEQGIIVDPATYFDGYNKIGRFSNIYKSNIGLGTYIAGFSNFSYAKIGRFCSIGRNVTNYLGQHPTNTFVSTHPCFFSTMEQSGFTFTEKQLFEEHTFLDSKKKFVIEIGNDVWIGNNVTIIDGIRIGDGAIVATGAVVTKNIEPYSIVGGIPVRLLKYRFSIEEINFLRSFKWWKKDIRWIKEHSKYFKDINLFIESFKK